MMTRKSSGQSQLILAMVIFGTIGLVRRLIPCPSSVIALFRAVIGVACLLLFKAVKHEQTDRAMLRRYLPQLIVSGVLIGANWIALFEAYRYTTVSVATMCYYMAPVLIMLFSPLAVHERLTRRKVVCAAAAMAGMVLVSGVAESGMTGMTGVLLGLAAAVMYAVIILLNKRMACVPGNDRTLVQLSSSAVSLLPYVLLTEDLSTLSLTPSSLSLLVMAGVVHTGFAYALYFGSLKTVPAQTAALLSYIDPVLAVILSVLVLREPTTPLTLVGVCLVLGAMLFSELPVRAGRER